jgi:4'-phosphopantetheinyl transferase
MEPEACELPVDRVDVWVISLLDPHHQHSAACLSADERARAVRFAFDRDRRRFEAGRGALRRILASYLRCTPSEVVFAYDQTGKPRLDAPQTVAGLQFNASGSADLAVCAIACDCNVGIDIELIRDEFDSDLVRYALSDSERTEFQGIPFNQQTTAFYRAWTRKEAYLKAIGCGLSRPLSSFAVSVTAAEPPRLVHDDSATTATESWSFADFDPAPGWVGTVVCSGSPRAVRLRAGAALKAPRVL